MGKNQTYVFFSQHTFFCVPSDVFLNICFGASDRMICFIWIDEKWGKNNTKKIMSSYEFFICKQESKTYWRMMLKMICFVFRVIWTDENNDLFWWFFFFLMHVFYNICAYVFFIRKVVKKTCVMMKNFRPDTCFKTYVYSKFLIQHTENEIIRTHENITSVSMKIIISCDDIMFVRTHVFKTCVS